MFVRQIYIAWLRENNMSENVSDIRQNIRPPARWTVGFSHSEFSSRKYRLDVMIINHPGRPRFHSVHATRLFLIIIITTKTISYATASEERPICDEGAGRRKHPSPVVGGVRKRYGRQAAAAVDYLWRLAVTTVKADSMRIVNGNFTHTSDRYAVHRSISNSITAFYVTGYIPHVILWYCRRNSVTRESLGRSPRPSRVPRRLIVRKRLFARRNTPFTPNRFRRNKTRVTQLNYSTRGWKR